MSDKIKRMTTEAVDTSIIRIYHYRDRNPQGVFYHMATGQEQIFKSLTQLVLQIEQAMETEQSARNMLYSDTQNRLEKAELVQQLQLAPEQEPIATFKVRVLFRRGESWQGKVVWMDSQKEVAFRSVLELIKIMDDVLA